ncbi:hypothetical protein [Rhodococcus jostii]|uniref:hypothetical protein n=1 Tax=Rhodococcus jostii TaxID=132919 RepID=UPI003638B2FF
MSYASDDKRRKIGPMSETCCCIHKAAQPGDTVKVTLIRAGKIVEEHTKHYPKDEVVPAGLGPLLPFPSPIQPSLPPMPQVWCAAGTRSPDGMDARTGDRIE